MAANNPLTSNWIFHFKHSTSIVNSANVFNSNMKILAKHLVAGATILEQLYIFAEIVWCRPKPEIIPVVKVQTHKFSKRTHKINSVSLANTVTVLFFNNAEFFLKWCNAFTEIKVDILQVNCTNSDAHLYFQQGDWYLRMCWIDFRLKFTVQHVQLVFPMNSDIELLIISFEQLQSF